MYNFYWDNIFIQSFSIDGPYLNGLDILSGISLNETTGLNIAEYSSFNSKTSDEQNM